MVLASLQRADLSRFFHQPGVRLLHGTGIPWALIATLGLGVLNFGMATAATRTSAWSSSGPGVFGNESRVRERKSVGKEITLERDLADRGQIEAILAGLAEQVERRLTDLELIWPRCPLGTETLIDQAFRTCPVSSRALFDGRPPLSA